MDGKTAARLAAAELVTGAKIGRYVVLEKVGSGAMGVVYGAYDPELDRKIALKLLIKSAGAQRAMAPARLLREAKAMARLAHPNVIAVHDVGLYEQQVFLAMEFVSGGTLRSWLRESGHSWREMLDVFVAAGRGLAAAHAAGLVHRDFKPENVLLDKDGRPRVVDFGLAREASGGSDDDLEPEAAETLRRLTLSGAASRTGGAPLETLTRTGALMGTPAYMAPEQFLGERADERTDQFSFCVALFEALYGERPFAGEDLISLSVSVTEGQLRPLRKDRVVPAWVRRVILRGLKTQPAERWASMATLIAALEADPAVKRRRRLIAVGALAMVVATLLVARQMVLHKRVEVEREIARHVSDALQSAKDAQAKVTEVRQLRQGAFAAFDAMNRTQGEMLWRNALALVPQAETAFERAVKAFETALVLDGGSREVRRQLADELYQHLLFVEELRLPGTAPALTARVLANDVDGSRRKQLSAPGTLTLTTVPAGVETTLARYDRDASGRRTLKPVGPVSAGDHPTVVEPGSYRLTATGPGLVKTVRPFEIGRGERLAMNLSVPAVASVPAGFVYVPAGEFWFGDADEPLRTQFLGTVPIHRRTTDAYLIAQHETTYGEWIIFLNALPEGERTRYAPDVSAALHGSLRLRELSEGESNHSWQIAFQPATQRYSARVGQSISYVGRKQRAHQDWLRFPVAGVSPAEVNRYLSWLRSTGQVPGARLCNELEWERAARGADDRSLPHGEELQADDANFDITYGRVDSAFGPDMVGSHPASRSPFEVDDLAGNLFEFVISSLNPDEIVIRGGAYYFTAYTCRSTNREPVQHTFRDVTTGIRVCAAVQGG